MTTTDPSNRDLMVKLVQMDERLKETDHRIRHVETHITGGDNPERGFHVRVDRLEQRAESAKWWTQTTAGAAITAIAASVWSIFSKH